MDKSFYFEVEWNEANEKKKELISLGIPFTVEQKSTSVIFAIPDLPVRQYSKVIQLFGSTGLDTKTKEAD